MAFVSTTLNDAIDVMTSQMTSYLLYIMTLAGKLLKKSTEFLSSKYLGANFANDFGVCQLILKPVQTYYVWTKHYHMQLCFDVAVHVKRDKNHFKFVMFLKASRRDLQKGNSLNELDIRQGHTRYY